jgi:hypothetical protein
MTEAEIGAKFGVTHQAVRYWRIKHQLPRSAIRTAPKGNVKYSTNREYFSIIDTPEKAYILGFILADGSVHRNGRSVSIAIKESDDDLLRRIAAAMDCDAPLHRKVPTNRSAFGNCPLAVLHLSGQQLVRDLATLGVYPDKSHNATYPAVPAQLESHLVRGLSDGDGTIGKRQFWLMGTDALMAGVASAVQRHTGCELRPARRYGCIYLRGSARDCAAMHWMYADASISLERKAETYRQCWSHRVPGKALPRGRSARPPVQSL